MLLKVRGDLGSSCSHVVSRLAPLGPKRLHARRNVSKDLAIRCTLQSRSSRDPRCAARPLIHNLHPTCKPNSASVFFAPRATCGSLTAPMLSRAEAIEAICARSAGAPAQLHLASEPQCVAQKKARANSNGRRSGLVRSQHKSTSVGRRNDGAYQHASHEASFQRRPMLAAQRRELPRAQGCRHLRAAKSPRPICAGLGWVAAGLRLCRDAALLAPSFSTTHLAILR